MYNNKDLTSMGLTHTQLLLVLVHEKLVTCTKRTPEPLQALSAAYPMNSGAEKEPHEETNPHRKPSRREGRKTSVLLHRRIFNHSLAPWHLHLRCGRSHHPMEACFPHYLHKTSTNTEETSRYIAVHRCWQKLVLKAFSQRR